MTPDPAAVYIKCWLFLHEEIWHNAKKAIVISEGIFFPLLCPSGNNLLFIVCLQHFGPTDHYYGMKGLL